MRLCSSRLMWRVGNRRLREISLNITAIPGRLQGSLEGMESAYHSDLSSTFVYDKGRNLFVDEHTGEILTVSNTPRVNLYFVGSWWVAER